MTVSTRSLVLRRSFPQPVVPAASPPGQLATRPAATLRRPAGRAISNVPPPVGTPPARSVSSSARWPADLAQLSPRYVDNPRARAGNLAAAVAREDAELRRLIDQATRITVTHPARRRARGAA